MTLAELIVWMHSEAFKVPKGLVSAVRWDTLCEYKIT